MNLRLAAVVSCAVLGLAQGAWAQDTAAGSTGPQAQTAPGNGAPGAAGAAAVDVSRLPIDVRRIQRELSRTSERVESDGFNLRYVIDVFGQAPPIKLFTKEDNLTTGQAPYGAPTHRDMIYMITPQEFRAPAMDFSALSRWLTNRAKK